MELRVLNYFLVIARESNFTKAAEQLHITQPTLSRQIAQLEEELGVKLFVRSNHSIILTEAGMMLKRRAQELLSLADKTRKDISYIGQNLEGTLSIGCGEFLANRCLADCIAAFRQEYPQVKYEPSSGNTAKIQDGLERGLLDIGLLSEPVNVEKYDFIPMPVREQWGALVRKDSPLAEKSVIRPQDLVGVPVVSALGDTAQSNIGLWLNDQLPNVNIIAKGDLLYSEAMLAQSNVGVVLGIRLNCCYEGLKFIPLFPAMEHRTVLAWKKEQIRTTATMAFLEFAQQYLKGIADDKK